MNNYIGMKFIVKQIHTKYKITSENTIYSYIQNDSLQIRYPNETIKAYLNNGDWIRIDSEIAKLLYD